MPRSPCCSLFRQYWWAGTPDLPRPTAVPGTIQAENYDTGGQGLGYNVTSVNGSGTGYRTDGVDLESTSDTGGGWNFGWTGAGQMAALHRQCRDRRHVHGQFPGRGSGCGHRRIPPVHATGTNLTGNVNIPATGAWQTWATVTANLTLPAGQQTLTLSQDSSGWNLNSITLATSGGGGPTTINPAAWYTVANQNSSACVDATESGTTNGTPVQQWACGGSLNQQWQFTPISNGDYKVLNRNSAAQNQTWDVTGGPSATAPGTKVQTWSYGGGTNQLWQPVAAADGYYTFVVRNSGLCLTVTGSSTANGALLEQNTCNGSSAQAFKLTQQP